ncbi:MAG: protein phosphatase CheZ, partial [Alphaproteobacteria bacterium]|nr:protein phosphatase CheZ [Alphaproteobacteria bacterium]
NIFLACSFQDITGQRITKVVNALHCLEQRVGAMIEIWGSESLRHASKKTATSDHDDPEAGLLDGPQLAGRGVDQDEIDRLLVDEAAPTADGEAAEAIAEVDVAAEELAGYAEEADEDTIDAIFG